MITKKLLQYLLMALMFFLASPVTAKIIKIATLSPDGTRWMNEMRAGAAEIKEKTQGRVVLKFYPGGVMGNDSNVLRKIRIGQLHGGAITTGSLSGIDPDIDIYGLPYLFSSLEQVDFVREKLDKALVKGLEEKGYVSFGFGEGGFTYMMSDSALRTVEDVRKKKVWLPANNKVGDAVFSSAEVSPVSLPLSDVLTGLQTGLVNTIITSPIGAIALQWHTRVQYLVDFPLTYITATLVIDKKVLNKLKKGDQNIVREVMTAVFKKIDAANRSDNNAARQALLNQGIEFITLNQDSTNEWYAVGKMAMKKLEKENKYSDAIYNLIKKTTAAAKKAHP